MNQNIRCSLQYFQDLLIFFIKMTVSKPSEANKILNSVYTWFRKNKLKLNILKLKYIPF